MAHRKPAPLYSRPARSACPVCGEISYSVAGIHPQCAVRQADAARMESIQQSRRTSTTDASPGHAWQKACPQCAGYVHVRRKTCDCGHSFSGGRSVHAEDAKG